MGLTGFVYGSHRVYGLQQTFGCCRLGIREVADLTMQEESDDVNVVLAGVKLKQLIASYYRNLGLTEPNVGLDSDVHLVGSATKRRRVADPSAEEELPAREAAVRTFAFHWVSLWKAAMQSDFATQQRARRAELAKQALEAHFPDLYAEAEDAESEGGYGATCMLEQALGNAAVWELVRKVKDASGTFRATVIKH
jgi:hypothetical protein